MRLSRQTTAERNCGGPGLADSEENARSLDPRNNDTDADLVPDAVEIYRYRNDPADQDTDNDGLSDMTEVILVTSLTLADTDGDQFDDREEIVECFRNPQA